MKKKPIIGILPLKDTERKSLWMIPGYLGGIEVAGGVPIILPLTKDKEVLEQLFQLCNGFLFTGGQDINPEFYGEKKREKCGEISEERDYMEKYLFERCLLEDKSILGICRGMQFLNVMKGGTLYQDLPSEHPSEINHQQNPPYDIPVHNVKLMEGTPLQKLLQKDMISVNSYHHQAIKELSENFLNMAVTQDHLVEAIYIPDKKFVWGVQWHPELNYKVDEDSRKIFAEFVIRSCA